VLAYSDQMRIEHYARAAKEWKLVVLTAPGETLDAVGFEIGVGQIYFDLPL
jgi:hypothetical protein